jgi:hypothetical protein
MPDQLMKTLQFASQYKTHLMSFTQKDLPEQSVMGLRQEIIKHSQYNAVLKQSVSADMKILTQRNYTTHKELITIKRTVKNPSLHAQTFSVRRWTATSLHFTFHWRKLSELYP